MISLAVAVVLLVAVGLSLALQPNVGEEPVVAANSVTTTTTVATTTTTSPEATTSSTVLSTEPEPLDVFNLTVGHCFVEDDDPLGEDEELVETVDTVPCAVSHDYEVYHAFDIPGDNYPGTEVVDKAWVDGCLAEFENFVGKDFDTSILDVAAIFPSEESWNWLDDRLVVCTITAVDGQPRTGTAEGSGV